MSEPLSDEILDSLVNVVPFEESRFYKEVCEGIKREGVYLKLARAIRFLMDEGYTLEGVAERLNMSVEETKDILEAQDD